MQLFEKKIRDEIANTGSSGCPNCGHHTLTRIRRKGYQRVLSNLFFESSNLRRYNCPRCEWKGLKQQRKDSVQMAN